MFITIITLGYLLPSGSNTIALYPVLIFLMIYTEIFKKNPIKSPDIIIPFLLILVLIPANYLLRWFVQNPNFNIEFYNRDLSYPISILINRILDSIYNEILFFNNYHGSFLFGLSFLYILLQPIPRFIFHQKPLLIDAYLTEYFNITYAQLQFGPIVEGYINFSFLGCFLWGFLSVLTLILFNKLHYSGKVYTFIYTLLVWNVLTYDFGINRAFLVNCFLFFFYTLIILEVLKGWKILKK